MLVCHGFNKYNCTSYKLAPAKGRMKTTTIFFIFSIILISACNEGESLNEDVRLEDKYSILARREKNESEMILVQVSDTNWIEIADFCFRCYWIYRLCD